MAEIKNFAKLSNSHRACGFHFCKKARACVKKSVNKKAFYDKIKKIIGGVFYV